MGFKKDSKTGAPNRKGHRWINYPNNAHKKCTKCGCMVDITCSKGVNVSIYTDMNGNKSNECPNCIQSLWKGTESYEEKVITVVSP